jgi:hypothetical protein
MVAVINIMPIKFKDIPVFAISAMRRRRVPKIIAFGGVATGIIKAQEADRVAGIIRSKGLILIATATPAKIGRTISVVAVFEVSSVKKVSMAQINIMMKMGWSTLTPVN